MSKALLQDCFAVFSVLAVVVLFFTFVVPIGVWLGLLVTELGDVYLQRLFYAVLITSLVLAVGMWVWMLAECAVSAVKSRNPARVGWLLAIALLVLPAWLYYFVEWRWER